MFPAPNRVGADVEEAGEQDLAGVERAADLADIAGPKLAGRRRKLGGAEVRDAKAGAAAPLKRQRVLERFAEIVEDPDFDFLGHIFHLLLLDAFHQLAEK